MYTIQLSMITILVRYLRSKNDILFIILNRKATVTNKSKSKFFESKDIINIAIGYNQVGQEQLLSLVYLLFYEFKQSEILETIVPIGVYKLFISYDDLDTFQHFINIETNITVSDIVAL